MHTQALEPALRLKAKVVHGFGSALICQGQKHVGCFLGAVQGEIGDVFGFVAQLLA